MTELAPAPGERAAETNGGRDHAHPSLDRRRHGGGRVGPDEPGVQPGDGAPERRGRPGLGGGGRSRPCRPRRQAFASWRTVSLAKRAELMFNIRELVHARKQEIAKLLVAEHGKVLSDAMGEVTRGLEVIEFACGIPTLLKGEFSEQASTGVDVYSIRQPRRCGGGDHAVQLPGDGADVDVGAGARVRQHVRAEAVREGSVGVDATRRSC